MGSHQQHKAISNMISIKPTGRTDTAMYWYFKQIQGLYRVPEPLDCFRTMVVAPVMREKASDVRVMLTRGGLTGGV